MQYVTVWEEDGEGAGRGGRCPTSNFREIAGTFVTVFPRKGIPDRKYGETVEKTRVKTREKILRILKKRPEITIKELAEEIGLSSKGVEWNIRKLKEEGVLERVGPAKGGRWVVRMPPQYTQKDEE